MEFQSLKEYNKVHGDPYSDNYFEFINFPKPNGKISGVYMFGEIYVGASRDIYKRIKQHYKAVRNNEHSNDDLTYYVNYCLSIGEKIQITFLAFDVMDEAYFSMKHRIIPPKSAKFYHQVYSKN